MTDNFEYQCRRRFTRQQPVVEEAVMNEKELLGAGSGGDDGKGIQYYDGVWGGDGTQVHLTAGGVEETENVQAVTPLISLLAGNGHGGSDDGLVTVRGSQGVRITSGPLGEPQEVDDTNGVEIMTGTAQEIHINRGLDSDAAQGRITMTEEGIGINAKAGRMSLSSDYGIQLKVAGGTSSITLTADRIVIKGPMVLIN